MKDKLAGSEKKSLQGQTVMITRAREQAGELSQSLEKLGAEVVEFPTIKIVLPDNLSQLRKAAEHLEEYDWLIFTSANGVKYFFKQLKEWGRSKEGLKELKIATIGPATARSLQEEGLIADFIPQEYRAEAILESLRQREGKLAGLKILIPRAKVAREVLPQKLKEGGAQVDVVVTYQTVVDDSAAEQARKALEAGEVDIITFTSSSTVRNFVKLLEGLNLSELLKKVQVVCIGPITAGTAEKLGLRVDAVAKEYTVEGLVEALLEQ